MANLGDKKDVAEDISLDQMNLEIISNTKDSEERG